MPGAADRGRTASSTGGPDRDPTWDGWRANWAGITARAPTTTPLQVAQAARATLASAVRGARRPWWRGVEQLTRTLCRSTSRRVEPARGAIRVCWIASWQRMILATTDGCAVLGWLVDRPNPLWSTCLLLRQGPGVLSIRHDSSGSNHGSRSGEYCFCTGQGPRGRPATIRT